MVFTTRSAVSRSNQAYYSQLAQTESLDWGIVYYSPKFPHLGAANQFREVIVDSGERMIEAGSEADRYFEERGLFCRRWAPSVETDPERLASYLLARGYERNVNWAMRLVRWPQLSEVKTARILPARAMRDAYRESYFDSSLAAPDRPDQTADAALERLDDASMDMFVAMIERKPVGHGGLFMVGDIARVKDLAVLPEWRRHGVATALLRHILTVAHRLAPRVVCLECPSAEPSARSLFERCGFEVDGELVEFHRAPGSGRRP